MRAKKVLVTGLVVFGLALTGCGKTDQAFEASVDQLIEASRQQGYNEAYVEIKYGISNMQEDEEYVKYLAVKQQYKENKSSDNYEELVKATQKLLQNLK